MRRDPRPRLIVPALLAVTSFGPACAGDKSPTPTGETGMLTESAETGEPATTAADTTTAPTTAADTTTAGSTDTGDTTGGEIPDCEQFGDDMAACQAMAGCIWEPELMSCMVDCMLLTDEASCTKAMICAWFDGVCYPPI